MTDLNAVGKNNEYVINKRNLPQQYHELYDSIAARGGDKNSIDTTRERTIFAKYLKKEVENKNLTPNDYSKITGFNYISQKNLDAALNGFINFITR